MLALVGVLCCGELPASEAAPQPLDAVARRAEAAVRQALAMSTIAKASTRPGPAAETTRVAARSVDPRLRLAACGSPLEASLSNPASGIGARTVVTVRCAGPSRWSVLVPVTVETDTTVLVAARALPRGTTPGLTDVTQVRRTLPGSANSYITNLEMLEGLHLARPVATGTPLTRDMLAADPVVRRGENVTLVASQGGFEIRATGRALADAAPGQPVRVQNVNSLKIVEGRADNAGVVRVDP